MEAAAITAYVDGREFEMLRILICEWRVRWRNSGEAMLPLSASGD